MHMLIIITSMSGLYWVLAVMVLMFSKAAADRYQIDQQLAWAIGVVWFVVLAGIAFAHSRLDALRRRMDGLEKAAQNRQGDRESSSDPM